MTNLSDFFNIRLPKWPALVVVGKPVTRSQAQEILVRTDDWNLCTNDTTFLHEIGKAFGLRVEDWHVNWEDLDAWRNRLAVLELGYLHNERIASAWIGGPKGWCDWEGRIGCSTYNIGKWPSVAEVYGDWRAIAAAFPFLTLTAQLWSGETCEEGIEPVVEFFVANGKAGCRAPQSILDRPGEPRWSFMDGDMAEQGTTIESLREAVGVVLAKRGLPLPTMIDALKAYFGRTGQTA